MSGRTLTKHAPEERGPQQVEHDTARAVFAQESDAEPADAQAVSRRRSPERRGPDRVHTNGSQPSADATVSATSRTRYFLPSHSRALALFVLLAFIIAAGVAWSVPPLVSLLCASASVALLAAGSVWSQMERMDGTSDTARYALAVWAIAVPMAATGYALANWTAYGLSWQWAVATIISINAATAALLGSRIISLIAAKVSIWGAFALIDPSPLTISAVVAAGIALFLVARFEWQATERRRANHEARDRVAARADDILRSFEDTGLGWFWETDRRGQISYISPSAAEVVGKSVEELLGRPITEMFLADPGKTDADRTLAFHLSARSGFRELALRAAGSTEERWWALTGRPIYDGFQNFCGFRGHGTDLTEKRRSEQQVTRLAHYDSLTGLANRVQIGEVLEQILAAPRERDRVCSIIMLDLDRFKQVNDTLGHPAGDALLKQVAQRLARAVDGGGRCGRLGGDEFQVIVPGYATREQLSFLSSEIIALLSQPYTIEGHNVIIGASCGVAIAPEHGTTSEELIRNADLALYAAKDAGRGVHKFYADDLHSAAEERAELEQDLRQAIARGELHMYYQPVVSASEETIVGFEALMRWKHSRRGLISPAKFIPIAEDTGLIDQLGQWALRSVCEQLATWPDSIRCAVNVSPIQFSNPKLPTIVANALAHACVRPSRLELEITESVFINDSEGTDEMFKALKRVGVRLALDDFGTGYSSLGYLRKAPFDKIKIDRSFVQGATESGSRNGAIISSITSLANALNMDTTAEGVEEHDELELVRKLGCSHIQGFIYSRPISAKAASELVAGDLKVAPSKPKATRAPRQIILRRVIVVYEGKSYDATIRNISQGGAMIKGVWGFEPEMPIEVHFSGDTVISAQIRWSHENCIGVEFAYPLKCGEDGVFEVLRTRPDAQPAVIAQS